MFDTSDIEVCFGADDKGEFSGFALADIGKGLVIVSVALHESLYCIWILVEAAADHTRQGTGLLYVSGRARENDDIALISLLLHKAERNRIR